jgi:2-hydroxy-3-oxopropionate reductase
MAKIAYIGLGIMGAAIARNLLKAGHEVLVHNRSQAKVAALVAEGAKAVSNPQEAAAQVDFIFTNLPDSPDVEGVVLGPQGILAGAHPGLIFIDNSTIKPETARHLAARLAEVGVMALDAPVSGGDVGARDGTLSIMVGGPAEAFEKAYPIFMDMGKKATLVGESGAGQIAKACNQIICAMQMVALGEALVLAQKAGVDPQKVVSAIEGGAAQMWTLQVKPPRIFAGNRQPGFKAYMQLKDLNICLDTGRAYGVPLPTTAVITQLFQSLVQQGDGELDNSAVLNVLEQLAKTQVGPDFR